MYKKNFKKILVTKKFTSRIVKEQLSHRYDMKKNATHWM